MRKPFIAFILTITMVIASCMPAFGAGIPDEGTTEITVSENDSRGISEAETESNEAMETDEAEEIADTVTDEGADAEDAASGETGMEVEELQQESEEQESEEQQKDQQEEDQSDAEDWQEEDRSDAEGRPEADDQQLTEENEPQPAEEDRLETAGQTDAETAPQTGDTSAKAKAEDLEIDELEVEDLTPEAENYQPGEDMPADDLFAAYVNGEFGISNGSPVRLRARRVPAGSRLSGVDLAIYNYISAELPLIASGERTSTIFEIPVEQLGLEQLFWTAEELGVGNIVEKVLVDGVEKTVLTSEAKAAVKARAWCNLSKILDALLADHPYLLYWYYKTEDTTAVPYTYLGKKVNGEWVIGIKGNVTFKLPVLPEYATDEYEVDPSTGQAVQAAVSNAGEIVSQYSGLGDLDILTGYKDEICDLTSYNREAAARIPADGEKTVYGDPWQLIWVFDGDPETSVVCEGYAKAFKYLCDRTSFEADIDCRTVTGEMNGVGHMWNIVNMDDDANYLVDVTNCDTNTTGDSDRLFLVGTAGSPQEGYTFLMDTGKSIRYLYDDDMLELWGNNHLTLKVHGYGKHEFGDWVLAKEPACAEEGINEKACTICGDKITEPIPALGHVWSTEYTVDREATYDEEGSKSIHCTVCGEIQEGSQVAIARPRKPIRLLTITGIAAKTYNRKAQTQAVVVKDGDTVLEKGTDYTVSYENNINAGQNTAIIKITGIGHYTGTVSKTFTIRKAVNTITAKNIVKIFSPNTRTFSLGVQIANGTPLYRSDSKSITVDRQGRVTVKAGFVGKASITITAREYINYSQTTKTITVLVKPTSTVLTSVTAVEGGKMTVRWRKRIAATGYQIQYSTSAAFTGVKSAWTTKNTVLTKTITGLAKGKNYYVRVRTYRITDGVKYYSDWSNVLTVKINK